MEMQARKEGNAVVVSIKGKLDATSSSDFENELSKLMAEGEKHIVIDFGDLDYISSAGLRSILITAKKLNREKGRLLLSALRQMVKEVFEISGFNAIIPVYDSVESALADI